MKNILNEARSEAIKVLKKCSHKKGLYASGTDGGYTSVWSRDSNISFLGGALIGEEFKKVFGDSLASLAKNQSKKGQIPNAIGIWEPLRNSSVSYNTLDSSLWFIVGEYVYAKAYNDKKLLKKHKKAIEMAFTWIIYRDFGEEGLLAQLPTTDWQDAFPHKYGHTINSHALYYAVLRFLGKNNEAKKVKELIGGKKRPDLALWDNKKGYFLPWAWKDHDGDREQEDWFDSSGNLLAIISGLASQKQATSILSYIDKKKINRPYPVKVMFPAIEKGSKLWKSYFSACEPDKKVYHYLNGGIWPYIGGFYVAALVKAGQFAKAEKELLLLTEANKIGKETEWEFNEWLDGIAGKPRGNIYQAWSAGGYLLAHWCVENKKIPFFK